MKAMNEKWRTWAGRMSDRLNTILERLRSLPDLARFGDIIEIIRDVYDVDHVCYYAMSLGLDTPVGKDDFYVASLAKVDGVIRRNGRQFGAMSYAPEWIQQYVEANFFASDPVVVTAQARFDPLDWGELSWDGTDQRRFRDEAIINGVGNQGYSIPVRGPSGQLAVFTVNKQCRDEDWAKLLNEWRTDFMLLAHFTHQQVLRLAGHDHMHQTRPLSNRERDAVRLIAEGLSRGQASERLGISENTFRVYIDSARHKLGALNIPHAVALAAHRGIIPPS